MPAEHVELVRCFYAALNANDLGSVRAIGDDDIEYVNPDAATEPGTRIGPDAFRAAFEGLHASFDGFRCEPEVITPFRDLMVVVARSTGTGRMSDIPFTEVHGHLLALRDDRITSFRWFQTVEEAYATASERSFREGMDAYSRGDYERALAGFHPEIEWRVEQGVMPDAEVYRGHDGVRRFWGTWAEAVEGLTLDVEECRAVGDGCVLAVTRSHGTGASSGAAVASRSFAQVAEFRDGLVVRVRLFGDVKRALAALR
jgi:ketosteroid isomerase-like protein